MNTGDKVSKEGHRTSAMPTPDQITPGHRHCSPSLHESPKRRCVEQPDLHHARPPLSMPARLHSLSINESRPWTPPQVQYPPQPVAGRSSSSIHASAIGRSHSTTSLRSLPVILQQYPANLQPHQMYAPVRDTQRRPAAAATTTADLIDLTGEDNPASKNSDDDLMIDEEMTNKDVCIGMIQTDIVTLKVLNLAKGEQYEPVHLESEGKRDQQNYSFTVTSRGLPRKFYGWVPFEETKVLGPLTDHGLIWWDAIIPRAKVNPTRTPLYIILYCRSMNVDTVIKFFERHNAALKDPPFFNPACRYQNPHGRSIKSASSAGPLAAFSSRPGSQSEQTKRDIAQLLDSIPSDTTSLSRKRRKKRKTVYVIEPDDSQMQVEEEEDNNEGVPVDGLRITLMPHQERGVEWMIDREENASSSGGILADMGLGKTIQTIGLITATQSPAASKERRVTLIVTPLALIQQWAMEIQTKTVENRLSVLVHHGPTRTRDPKVFANYDVVITTYQVVASDMPNTDKKNKGRTTKTSNLDNDMFEESAPSSTVTSPGKADDSEDEIAKSETGRGPLLQFKWYRVVLDEAQQIKNRATRSALSCTSLIAEKRWCLTGTPIQNHVDELYSLLRFLRIQPLCDYQTFRKTISIPIQLGQGELALERLKVVLMAVMLRRTKQQILHHTAKEGEEEEEERRSASDHASLRLPAREKQDILLTFSREERVLYDMLNTKTRDTVERIFRAGKGERNYLNMLCMLLRLRQACDHPQLVLKSVNADPDALELATSGLANNNKRESSEAAAQRFLMAKMAADLGWQGVEQDVDANRAGKECELCGRSLSVSYSNNDVPFCATCKEQIDRCTETISAMQRDADQCMMSTKVAKMIEILNETRRDYPREKTIVFSQFTSMLDLLETPLRKHGFKYCRYDGSMSSQAREKSLQSLRNDPDCLVMLISLKCGSLGLNLTAANRVILMDIWWNPAVEEQAIDRVHRIGQRLPVRVVRLMIDQTIEQKIIQLQEKKAQMVQGALGDGMVKNTKLSMKEIRTLFDL